MHQPASGPFFVTDSDDLLAALARVAAAAGVVPEVTRDPRSAFERWSVAPVVVIGADVLGEVARLSLPRRADVVVAVLGAASDRLFREALACGADDVLELPGSDGRLTELFTDTADGRGGAGVTIGVIGGAGGVGASTVAAALALVLARDGGALLVDADPLGGGADQLLGIGADDGVRWDALSQVAGRMSARSLRSALPARAGLSALTWSADRSDLTLPMLRAALSAGTRGFPAVVIDVPRGDSSLAQEALARSDHVLLVSTMTVPALTACAHLARRLPVEGVHVLLRGRGGVPDGEVERLLQHEVVHRMADQRGLDESISLGLGPLRSRRGPLVRAVRRVVDRLGLRTGADR